MDEFGVSGKQTDITGSFVVAEHNRLIRLNM